jgi:5-methylcytosine-specific restriction endonuclease McrA
VALSDERQQRDRELARARYYRRKKEDPEKVREESNRSSRRYYFRSGKAKVDREQERERVAEWTRRNPEKVRDKVRRRRSRLAGTRVEVDAAWLEVLDADKCAYCGGPGGTVDHIVPLFAGGDFVPDNLTGACRSCNSTKHTKSLLIYLLTRIEVT